MVAKILVGLLEKLATEKFFGRIIVLGLQALSKSTNNKIDDGICKAVADGLGEECDV